MASPGVIEGFWEKGEGTRHLPENSTQTPLKADIASIQGRVETRPAKPV